MFATTFLGHQGWLFRTDRACVAVDPLLCERFGAQHALDYQVFPPRRLDLSRFPALDAVVLTHEHDDHFDLPSLAKLSRKIPIHLSARSSTAAHAILREMGFRVVPLEPGVAVTFGDLEVLPLAGDHVNVDCGDEWDTLPLLVRDTGGAGSFFSMVDITPTERHLHLVKGVVGKPGLCTWTNNALDWSHMTDFVPEMTGSTEACAARMAVGRDLIREVWGRPAAMLLCAGGFSFHGDRAWLNRRVFPIDCERACASLQRARAREKYVSALPGQTFWMEGNRLVRVDVSTDFLATEPRDAWPSREQAPLADLAELSDLSAFSPASGARALGRGDLARLEDGLNELARALVGGPLFRCLHSMMAGESEGRRPTFAFALRDGARRHVFEYVPSACAFRPVEEDDPESAYLLGLECWAADLLRVLRGDLGPIALTFGRARLWNAAPDVVADVIFDELSRVSHPLRRPAETLRAYQRLWKRVPAARARVAAKKRAPAIGRVAAPIAVLMAALMGVGCASSATPDGRASAPEQRPAPALASDPAPGTRGACPFATRGMNLAAQEIERGTALVFTTSDDIAGLRASVTQLAELGAPPNAEVHFDNVDGGLRVLFEAAPASGVSGVRREVHERGRALAERCGLALGVVPLQAEPAKEARAAEPAPVASPGAAAKEEVPPPSSSSASPSSSAKPDGKTPKKKAASPAASASASAKPSDSGKPKEPQKPKEPDKPKEPEPPPKPPWRLGK